MTQVLAERELTIEGPRRRASGGIRLRSVRVNLAESSLTWLHARGHLSDRQFDAGERLRRDYELAQLGASVTMRWDPVRISGGGGEAGLTATERHLAAKRRFDAGLAAAGSDLADILGRVVCSGEGLPIAEKALDCRCAAASWSCASRSTASLHIIA